MSGSPGARAARPPTAVSAARIRSLVARHGTPLLIVDCEAVRRQYLALKRALPGVDLYYALKPLPLAAVVAELRDLGANFDVATSGEIRLVRRQGVAADRCMHTHPIKSPADIAAALRYGIRRFVVDNPDELRKFTRYRKRVELLLRVSFRNPAAVVDLSRKFGCEPAAVPSLLDMAVDLGLTIRGLSFHVGSQVADPGKYVEAIAACRDLMVTLPRAASRVSTASISAADFPWHTAAIRFRSSGSASRSGVRWHICLVRHGSSRSPGVS